MFGIFDAIYSFFSMVIDFVMMILNSLMTLFQLLIVGVPSVMNTLANMPAFIVAGTTVTISVCLCMVLIGRRSS